MVLYVTKLVNEVKPAMAPKLKKELSRIAEETVASLPGGRIDQPFEGTAVNGLPRYNFGSTYALDDTTLTTVGYFLCKGRYLYTLEGAAASQDREALKGKFEAAFQTFTVK